MSAENSVKLWIQSLNELLSAPELHKTEKLFSADAFWRDLVAFTWNYITIEGIENINKMLDSCRPHLGKIHFQSDGIFKENNGLIEAWIRFETQLGVGVGVVKLRNGKAEVLLTKLENLKGHEASVGQLRPRGVEHRADPARITWREKREALEANLGAEMQPYVVIVGGSQGGLGLAARLKQLGVPTLIIEQTPRIGDSWRNRYRTLVLHDPVWYDHMPYLPFPDTWPIFTPKDKMADWLEHYADIMELNIWTGARVSDAQFDGTRWQVTVEKAEEKTILSPQHIVFATGAYGPPRPIHFEGKDTFAGPILHSSQFRDGAEFSGKRVAVIGSASSAHDVCVSLWENNAQPIMIQRHPTTVVKSDTLMEMGFADYSQEALARGLTTEKADLLGAATPHKILVQEQIELYKDIAQKDAVFYSALKEAGFALDFGVDGSGQMIKALRTASGYYLDVGASQLIIDGQIKVIAEQDISHLSEGHIHFKSGESIEVDAIIACTGYGSMHEIVAQVIDQETADLVGPCWGVGSGTRGDPAPFTGELRNMWQPTAHPALWFHGGNLAMSRFNSVMVALQLKARMEGIPTPVYRP